MKEKTEFPEVYNSHVQTMLECMSICIACAKKCLEEGHKTTAALCSDCFEICALAIKSACSNSEFQKEIMELCALVCKKCGDECKKMKVKHCLECAEVCHRCADICINY